MVDICPGSGMLRAGLEIPQGHGCHEIHSYRRLANWLRRSARHVYESRQRYALDLSQYMTIQDVADHLGISWDAIKEIQKADLKRRFDRPKLKHLRQIAIDEISTTKGQASGSRRPRP